MCTSYFNKFLKRSFSRLSGGVNSFANLGRFYEEKCQQVLADKFDTTVKLVGGANDGGVDLFWSKQLESGKNLQFIGQCKQKISTKIGPSVCRELMGSLANRPEGTVGCLISNRRPTAQCLETLVKSPLPLIYFMINEYDNCDRIYEIVPNSIFLKQNPEFQILPIRNPHRIHYTFRLR